MVEENEAKQEEKQPLQTLSELYDKIKIENDRAETILKRNEELAARGLLGGKSDSVVETEKKEETPKEYLKRIGALR